MINQIFVERSLLNHPRAKFILQKFRLHNPIYIDHYGEIFNKKNQNFRIQKAFPNLILANKADGHVLNTPKEFGIGNIHNFYFSHMFNCLYDCDYCFLQGLYSSADFVLFVNYETFEKKILEKIKQIDGQKATFFSGYDCDSLGFESVSGFVKYFLPIFEQNPNALLELRTKSLHKDVFSRTKPIENCVIAYSLLPDEIARNLDRKAPSIPKRLKVMGHLAKKGWKIGLRFDPLIHGKDWKLMYSNLIKDIFENLPVNSVHSVTFGPLRFPKAMFKKLVKLNYSSKLLFAPLTLRGTKITYKEELEAEMVSFCEDLGRSRKTDVLSFRCTGNF